jgi:hypothetical protein
VQAFSEYLQPARTGPLRYPVDRSLRRGSGRGDGSPSFCLLSVLGRPFTSIFFPTYIYTCKHIFEFKRRIFTRPYSIVSDALPQRRDLQ